MANHRSLVTAVGALAGLYCFLLAGFGLGARPQRSDLAVVFGNAVVAGGRPSPRLQARLDTALALVRARLVRRVLVSGGVDADGRDEAAVMARYLIERGVPATVIIQDRNGVNTWATARQTAGLAPATTVIVTQWFHIPRATLAMHRFGLRRVSAAWPRFVEARDVYSFGREAIALPVYLFKRVAGPPSSSPFRPRP